MIIDALTCNLSPTSRIVGMILAVERGPHTFAKLKAAANLASWELEQAIRELGNPDRRLLVSKDLDAIELRDDVVTPFTSLLSSTAPPPKEKHVHQR